MQNLQPNQSPDPDFTGTTPNLAAIWAAAAPAVQGQQYADNPGYLTLGHP
jgi:hypothetical protein